MDLSPALNTFIAESRELLEDMESSLLALEERPDDVDLVNAVFRAAHTIKGSAGLFALEPIVGFTHAVESLLDRVRSGALGLDGELVALLLLCRDHMAKLIAAVDQGGDGAWPHQPEPLLAQVRGYLQGDGAQRQQKAGAPAPAPTEAADQEAAGTAASACWHVSLRFGPDVLRNGMDPASFIRYLKNLGEIVHVDTLLDALPEAEAMDPEACYLGFEIALRSEADKAAIDAVFDFVREDCLIRILPPHARLEDYARLIQELSEENQPLGEMLVASGALTRSELDAALALQHSLPAGAAPGTAEHPPKLLGEILVEERLVQQPLVELALEKQGRQREPRQEAGQWVRVEAAKLDQLINLVGELIIAGSGTHVLAQRSGLSDLVESSSAMVELTEEVRDAALKLRMVQIGATFERFRRVVRDVSKELGKDIELLISGTEAELDKSVVEKIGDPLLHLVRNAIDHGIEPVEARRAHGKPARGTLRLNAYHDSGSIVIEVADDGGGLDREQIIKKARERGLVAAGQEPGEQEVFNLIFEPGFSTAERVSNLSGRGVGMDVVKKNIAALRGTVELQSAGGRGTTVRIRMPLTLAIIDGFLVGVGRETFVIPLDMVVECVELEESAGEGHGRYVNLRCDVLPFLRLREEFAVGDAAARRESIVVVGYAGQKAGIVVDRLLGESQTVIKPLGRIFARLGGIAGSTILGSGEVALILDIPALVNRAAGSMQESSGATVH